MDWKRTVSKRDIAISSLVCVCVCVCVCERERERISMISRPGHHRMASFAPSLASLRRICKEERKSFFSYCGFGAKEAVLCTSVHQDIKQMSPCSSLGSITV